ncbi:S-adenosylmethionine tRNA ribosyltransferase [Kocuria sp. SM24M-10]|nr:S-adenosylmethionine tRNA ribosyltransferase [Kocuria sp. SM24M-10]
MRSVLLDLVRRRGAEKTVCPSEAARALAPVSWRDLMEDVRQEAYRLADDGLVDITQQGRVVDGRSARGPIRVRLR